MNDPRVEKQKPVPPFVQFCCAAVPMVFDDSLSYYEALCAMWKYLDETVKVINNNAMVTEDFIAKVNELHDYVENYFDNLDVQEEINNKLDQMALDGTLQEIITTYIQSNVAWTFDTVTDMKSAENLINGSYARTLGHDSLGDRKGGLYKIVDNVDPSYTQESLDSGLYANLIQDEVEYTFDKNFIVLNGSVANQTYQDKYVYLDNCNISECNFINCIVTGKATCNGSHGLILDDNSIAFRLHLDNDNITAVRYGIVLRGTNIKVSNCSFGSSFYESITVNGRNNVIENCIFGDSVGSETNYVVNIKVTKIRDNIRDNTYAVNFPEDVEIRNCNFLNKATDHIEFFTGGRNLRVIGCYFKNNNTNYISCKSYSYEREQGYNNQDDYTKNVLIESCTFIRTTHGNALNFIKHISSSADNFGVSDITINRCYFEMCKVTLNGSENITLSNNTVKGSNSYNWVEYSLETVDITTRNKLCFINNNVTGKLLQYAGLNSLYLESNNIYCDAKVITQANISGTYYVTNIYSEGNKYITSDSSVASYITFYQLYGSLFSNNDNCNYRVFIQLVDDSNIFIDNLLIGGGNYILNGANHDGNGNVKYLLPTGVTINESNNMGAGSSVTFTKVDLI